MIFTYPQRKHLRLKSYDYNQNGVYYITVCTQNRECLFGEIVDNKMLLNDMGICVETALHELVPSILLDAFVIMPNHVHAIIAIVETSVRTVPLGNLVRQFKGKSTFLINQSRKTSGIPVWQRGYYDHIVRNESDLHRIREYIENNPVQWALDSENPNI